jgi:hypothetical protein
MGVSAYPGGSVLAADRRQTRRWVFWLPGFLLASLPEVALSGVFGVRSR